MATIPTQPPTLPQVAVAGTNTNTTQADFATAFGTQAPLLVTLTPAPSKKRALSVLEITLIATAVAIGVVTLCLLLSISKR